MQTLSHRVPEKKEKKKKDKEAALINISEVTTEASFRGLGSCPDAAIYLFCLQI